MKISIYHDGKYRYIGPLNMDLCEMRYSKHYGCIIACSLEFNQYHEAYEYMTKRGYTLLNEKE